MGRYNWENRADRIGDLTVKTNISSTFCFLMFVILGLRVALAGGLRSSIAQRRRTNIFLCAVLLISFGAGLTQHNLWPFSSWPVLAYAVPTGSNYPPLPRCMGVDTDRREYDIDYGAWRPVGLGQLEAWIRRHLARRGPAAGDLLGSYQRGRGNPRGD